MSMFLVFVVDGSGGDNGELLRSAAAARRRTRRHVDRRASKGRRVRYTVMPKLVNFMAPNQSSLSSASDSSFVADELFRSLFGRSSSSPLPTVSSSASSLSSRLDAELGRR
jgi:protein AATF/BFR2